jgi:hypothetical protein
MMTNRKTEPGALYVSKGQLTGSQGGLHKRTQKSFPIPGGEVFLILNGFADFSEETGNPFAVVVEAYALKLGCVVLVSDYFLGAGEKISSLP